MILTPYQVYLLKKEFEGNAQTLENGFRNREICAILDASTVKIDYCDNQIGVGTTFCVAFIEDGDLTEEEVYTLVESKVSNESAQDGIISLNSPFGISVHRKRAGESFVYKTETGVLISGMVSKIYSKEEHQEFTKSLKEKTKKLGEKQD